MKVTPPYEDEARERALEITKRTEHEWERLAREAEEAMDRRVTELERKFKEAFPNGDWVGHCRYHEIQIEMLLARKHLTSAIQEKTLSGLAWSAMIFLGLAVLNYLKTLIK